MNRQVLQGVASFNDNPRINYVPTGFSMVNVLSSFLSYVNSEGGIGTGAIISAEGFVNWQVEVDGRKRNTARAYCYPLSDTEFRVYNRSLEDISIICQGGIAGLQTAIGSRTFTPGERDLVCLVDCYLVGRMNQAGLTADQCREFLIQAGLAGTPNSANTLQAVGSGVGRFFGLLNQARKPTEGFDGIFQKIGIQNGILGVDFK